MRQSITILVFCCLLIVTSCSVKTQQSKEPTVTEKPPPEKEDTGNIYFKSSGTEPFWTLEIAENLVKFKTPEDSVIAPHTDPLRTMDANVKLYKTQAEPGELNIQIVQTKCINAMSGLELPYTVTINYRKSNDEKFTTITGCGQYITDYRLQDIWVAEEMNGTKITKADFTAALPSMEIISSANTFSGFAGCNRMNGTLFFEKGLLRFTNIATTEMICTYAHKEAEFLRALQGGTTYTIANNRLTLSNPDGVVLIFKKTD